MHSVLETTLRQLDGGETPPWGRRGKLLVPGSPEPHWGAADTHLQGGLPTATSSPFRGLQGGGQTWPSHRSQVSQVSVPGSGLVGSVRPEMTGAEGAAPLWPSSQTHGPAEGTLQNETRPQSCRCHRKHGRSDRVPAPGSPRSRDDSVRRGAPDRQGSRGALGTRGQSVAVFN